MEDTIKAVCIDNDTEEYKDYKAVPKKEKVKGLTKDKEYIVKQSKEYEDYYEVMNDLNKIETYKKYRFKIVGVKDMEDKNIKVICKKDFIDFKKNKLYIAERTTTGAFDLKDDKGVGNIFYSADFEKLFEKVEDVLMVECIDNDRKLLNLTTGKQYPVISEDEIYYKVKNDYGLIREYDKSVFKPVEPQKEEKKEYSAFELLDFPVGTKFEDDRTIFEIVEFEEGNKGIVIAETKGEMIFSTNLLKTKFTLIEEPKAVTTSEAFKALEEGKTIESCKEFKYRKENGKIKCIFEIIPVKVMDFEELEGKWIILE